MGIKILRVLPVIVSFILKVVIVGVNSEKNQFVSIG